MAMARPGGTRRGALHRWRDTRCGELTAAALAGAWRAKPPPSQFPSRIAERDLARIAPQLLGSGAAALAWWKLRHSELAEAPVVLQLRQAHRTYALQTLLYEPLMERLIGELRAVGVEPVLIKGWVSARLYPEAGLRPYGDIDLCVPLPQQQLATKAVDALLRQEPGQAATGAGGAAAREQAGMAQAAKEQAAILRQAADICVEVHTGFPDAGQAGPEELVQRSLLVPLGATAVRILSPEDHLRLTCIHFLRHGAWRPLWLCDIACAVEACATDFDWDVCLGRDRVAADWVACAIGLAQALLGARLEHTPVAVRSRRLPRWLVPTVLNRWQRRSFADGPAAPELMVETMRRRRGLVLALRRRWPDPIEDTVARRARLGPWPPLAVPLWGYVRLTVGYLLRCANGTAANPIFPTD